jgi:hypothetical protein
MIILQVGKYCDDCRTFEPEIICNHNMVFDKSLMKTIISCKYEKECPNNTKPTFIKEKK